MFANKPKQEYSLDELRNIFSRDVDPATSKKIAKEMLKLDVAVIEQCNSENKPYPPKVQKFIHKTIRLVLGRKPTDRELKDYITLWREWEERRKEQS